MTERILMAHGSGGQTSHQLIARHLLGRFGNQWLDKMDDSAVIQAEGRLAFTTDSYVVTPYFFPGGDIGKLAICGTVNDLSVMGACPRFISLALILEEGLPVSELETILDSIKSTASQAGVDIVTGDTKVVQHGGVDGILSIRQA